MHCRNCGNEVNDKAIACPKCGVNPRTEKKFCPSCGVETNPNQVVCTKCGVSLGSQAFSFDISSLQKIDVNSFLKNKPALFALLALIGCFLPWVSINSFMSMSISCFGLSKLVDMAPGTILVSFLLYLFPLSLIAFIASYYIPQISKFKKIFITASLILIIYASIGLYLTGHPSSPNKIVDEIMDSAKNMFSIGIGFLYFAARNYCKLYIFPDAITNIKNKTIIFSLIKIYHYVLQKLWK
jgi:hypothetical protein